MGSRKGNLQNGVLPRIRRFVGRPVGRLIACFVVIGGVHVLSGTASAQEIHSFYTGVRQMGMGGAYTGVVNDETSLLTNPAGLSKIRDTTVTIADPELTGAMSDSKVLTASKVSSATNVQSMLDQLNKNPDTHFYGKLQVFPSLVTSNVGFGVLGNYQMSADVDSAKGNYDLFYRNDFAPVLGYSLRFWGGILKVGFDGRMVNRTEVDQTLPSNSTALTLNGLAKSGVGVGSDVGVILTAPVTMLPSLSATVRDVGTTSYDLSKGVTMSTDNRPHATAQTIDAGLSIFPIIDNRTRSSFTIEMHDATNTEKQKDLVRLAHAGGELNFADFLFLRAGFNEGYWTGGVEFATQRFQLQAASYGEEIGDYPTRKEDRRWVLKVDFRL